MANVGHKFLRIVGAFDGSIDFVLVVTKLNVSVLTAERRPIQWSGTFCETSYLSMLEELFVTAPVLYFWALNHCPVLM
jgi:hypothetical protein